MHPDLRACSLQIHPDFAQVTLRDSKLTTNLGGAFKLTLDTTACGDICTVRTSEETAALTPSLSASALQFAIQSLPNVPENTITASVREETTGSSLHVVTEFEQYEEKCTFSGGSYVDAGGQHMCRLPLVRSSTEPDQCWVSQQNYTDGAGTTWYEGDDVCTGEAGGPSVSPTTEQLARFFGGSNPCVSLSLVPRYGPSPASVLVAAMRTHVFAFARLVRRLMDHNTPHQVSRRNLSAVPIVMLCELGVFR